MSKYFAISFACSETIGAFSMAGAQCSCGAVTLSLPEEPSKIVVACHCIDCQRRTGAPFGVGAYYSADVVAISGTSKEFTHAPPAGGKTITISCRNAAQPATGNSTNCPPRSAVPAAPSQI